MIKDWMEYWWYKSIIDNNSLISMDLYCIWFIIQIDIKVENGRLDQWLLSWWLGWIQ